MRDLVTNWWVTWIGYVWVNIQYADGFPTEICCLTSYSHPARWSPLHAVRQRLAPSWYTNVHPGVPSSRPQSLSHCWGIQCGDAAPCHIVQAIFGWFKFRLGLDFFRQNLAVLVNTTQEITRRWCSMHACNLGIFLVVIAEGILLLARNLYHQLSLEESLQVTYLKFKSWLSTKGISCSQRRWTLRSLHMTGEVPNYPWLKAKAFNARVILGWLAETYSQHRRNLFFLCHPCKFSLWN